ncbi:MAG: hypothetical protein CMO55_04285 [Verrucomicrobiales bacterium]|nr:hypothetical protein [Verrucomicrobiales bacterium]
MSNRQLEENQQEDWDRRLAEELGITYDEICELSYDVDTNESSDGLVYNLVIRFSNGNPPEILKKISGLENNCIRIPAWDSDQ